MIIHSAHVITNITYRRYNRSDSNPSIDSLASAEPPTTRIVCCLFVISLFVVCLSLVLFIVVL